MDDAVPAVANYIKLNESELKANKLSDSYKQRGASAQVLK
jgi:hypothetical protein